MYSTQFARPLKIHQLDPDLQTRVKDLSLTSLAEFQALARQIRTTQEARWALRDRESKNNAS